MAIVGIGCPAAGRHRHPEALWQALLDGADTGGFLDDVTGFDADLFRIPPAEARRLDPRADHRPGDLLGAGGRPDRHDTVAHGLTGVFTGHPRRRRSPSPSPTPSTSKFQKASARQSPQRVAEGSGTSEPLEVAEGSGTSEPLEVAEDALAVATACGSSLAAVHLAVRCATERRTWPSRAASVRRPAADHTRSVRDEGCGILVLRRLSRRARRPETASTP
ncbi:beta-ketoacyl synthase N-terminal-like domain-containing protein [Streptomyces sp. KL116D]|uniref:beta-ketoacyl synthase N-terminal-like domain-containing protein n=1 Tax=Streptomyces sp. KL116D TaxID=3045152 RepID=UPI003557E5E3